MSSLESTPPRGHMTTFDWFQSVQGAYGTSSYQPFSFGEWTRYITAKSIHDPIHRYLWGYGRKPHKGFVATIPNGRVWGAYGAIITPDNLLLSDVSVDYHRPTNTIIEGDGHSIFQAWKPSLLQRLSGRAAVLTFCGAGNYFHWLYDVLPRLRMLRHHPYDHLIINPNVWAGFYYETLAMLGLHEEAMIKTSPETYLQADELVVPSSIMHAEYPKWATRTIRSMLLPYRDSSFQSAERIYISRRQAGIRKVVNEEAVYQLLARQGFVRYDLESLSVAEQIQLFSQAKVIVSIHGAALANLAFAAPQTKVIEWFHPEYVMPTYWMISNHNQLDYYYLLGEKRRREGSHHAGEDNIEIPLSLLRKTLALAKIKS
ncbi:glycosyltransferase family 61 protein [Paenibacillus aquistagni]|uniref:glycosyltransferase family 61 protein n=1 Tax=Paenibacillus aquistagni TaxID=1852522 RepID=UPI00145C076C|nr:glycosyltransferase family 61 protein [Paenibacillus aquistagni]NMM51317.1 glycosyltransferase family 61 protein [Paenibacillus aquistagni]